MAGAVDLNPNKIYTLREYAYRDDAGRWRAGPEAKGYDPGQFIPTKTIEVTGSAGPERDQTTYTITRPTGMVGRQYNNRRRNQQIKAIMQRQDVSESEARQLVHDIQAEIAEELEKDDPDPERLNQLRRRVRGS